VAILIAAANPLGSTQHPPPAGSHLHASRAQSGHTLHVISHRPLPLLAGFFARKPALFLVDSGATCNLVSRQFLFRNGLRHGQLVPSESLALPDRSSISLYRTPRCLISSVDFLAADVQGSFDIILGQPWLQAKNPDIDWTSHTVTLFCKGAQVTLQPQRSAFSSSSYSSPSSAAQPGQQGCTGTELSVTTLQGNSTGPSPSAVPPCISSLLSRFYDVFPAELPPAATIPDRAVQHTIDLESGATQVFQQHHAHTADAVAASGH
jgi:hypothetical protein